MIGSSYHSNSLFISQILYLLSKVFHSKVDAITFSKKVIEHLEVNGRDYSNQAEQKLTGDVYGVEFLNELSAFLRAVELESISHEKTSEIQEIIKSWRESNQFFL